MFGTLECFRRFLMNEELKKKKIKQSGVSERKREKKQNKKWKKKSKEKQVLLLFHADQKSLNDFFMTDKGFSLHSFEYLLLYCYCYYYFLFVYPY